MTDNGSTPVLSVTVLNYNYGHFLANCLDSILGQSFKDFELILINDKSTDDSLKVIEPYLADSRVRLVDHQENMGFVRSLVQGGELSRGRYISVISADDWAASPEAFAKQIAVLESDPEIAFAFGAYGHYTSEKDRTSYVWRSGRGNYVRDGKELFQELVTAPYVLHSGTIIRKTAYDAVGGYDQSLKYAVDTRMWLALCHVGKGAYIDEELYGYRRHPTSMSKTSTSIERTIREVLKVIEQSFEPFSAAERRELEPLHRRAVKRALIAYAADEVFRGSYREGFKGLRVAASIKPVETLVQRATAVVLLRAALGDHAFQLMRGLLGRTSSSAVLG